MVRHEQHSKGISVDMIVGLCRVGMRKTPGEREGERAECSKWRRIMSGDCESRDLGAWCRGEGGMPIHELDGENQNVLGQEGSLICRIRPPLDRSTPLHS